MIPPPSAGRTEPEPDPRLARIERLLGTDPAAAEAGATELLAATPGHPRAALFLGIARRLQGRAAAAIEVLAPLAEAYPGAAMVQLQLGLARRAADQEGAALEALRGAVQAQPDFSDAWLALGDLLFSGGARVEADTAFTTYARHATRDPRLAAPAAALRENRLTEADRLLRELLKIHPYDIVALCMLADVVQRQGRGGEAVTLLQTCLELAPGYRRARHNLAVVLLQNNNPAAALEQVETLLSQEPENPELGKLKAAILVHLLDYGDAIEIYERLLARDREQADIWSSLGHALRVVGRRDDSIGAYRNAIAIAPRHGEAYWNLANLKQVQFTDTELERMHALLADGTLTNEDRIHLHFALGKAEQDRKRYAESFRQYEQGNNLRRRICPYDADEHADFIRRSITLFDGEFFAQRRGWGAACGDPIFIVGLPRVGSTLVEQILASHSCVEGTTELPEVMAIAASLKAWDHRNSGPGYPEMLAGLEGDACRDLGNSYIDHTRRMRKQPVAFFIDKMPSNFAHLGLIHLILPQARIIDVRRHPMASGWSLYKQHFARRQDFGYSLEDIGRYYRDYVLLMTHFDRVLPGRVHRVFYEALVNNTEHEIRRLLEYCGLPFEQDCLHFYRNERAVSTPSSEQVRSPIYREAVEEWRNYEQWLGPLQSILGPFAAAYPELPGLELLSPN